MKNILVLTDFSKNAFKALEFAALNFKGTQQKIHLLNVYNLRYAGSVITEDLDALLEDERQAALEEQISQVKENYPYLRISSHLIQGHLIDAVTNFIEENVVDVIVMGTKGASEIEDLLVGSNATTILKYIDKPLILIPYYWVPKTITSALFATDLDLIKFNHTIEPLNDLLHLNNARVDVLNLTENIQEEDVERETEVFLINNAFLDIPHKFHYKQLGNASEDILETAHELNSDIIAVIPRTYNWFHKLMHKSITRTLSLHSDLPLFVLRDIEK